MGRYEEWETIDESEKAAKELEEKIYLRVF